MTSERNTYTGNATQTPNPAKPRQLIDSAHGGILGTPHNAAPCPTHRGSCPDCGADMRAELDAAHARERSWVDCNNRHLIAASGLRADLTASREVTDVALAHAVHLTDELNASRTEVARLRRLLDAAPEESQTVPLAAVVALIDAVRSSIDMPVDIPRAEMNARVWDTVGVLTGITTLDGITAARQILSAKPGPRGDAPLCAVRCPHGHDHTCARSPQHCGFHRDVKQKGTESCSWANTA